MVTVEMELWYGRLGFSNIQIAQLEGLQAREGKEKEWVCKFKGHATFTHQSLWGHLYLQNEGWELDLEADFKFSLIRILNL